MGWSDDGPSEDNHVLVANGTYTFGQPITHSLLIYLGGSKEPIVTISANGDVHLANNNPSLAAKAFWDAIKHQFPRCPDCNRLREDKFVYGNNKFELKGSSKDGNTHTS